MVVAKVEFIKSVSYFFYLLIKMYSGFKEN